MLGRISMDLKKWAPAERYFENMIKVAPKDPRGYIDLAECNLRQGNRSAAQRAVMRGQTVLPGHPALLQMLLRLGAPPTELTPPSVPKAP